MRDPDFDKANKFLMIKRLMPLLIVAVLANLLSIILYAMAVKAGSTSRLEFVYVQAPIIWLSAVISMLVLVIVYRKSFFSTSVFWTIFLMLCCTPIPLLLTIEIVQWLIWEIFGHNVISRLLH